MAFAAIHTHFFHSSFLSFLSRTNSTSTDTKASTTAPSLSFFLLHTHPSHSQHPYRSPSSLLPSHPSSPSTSLLQTDSTRLPPACHQHSKAVFKAHSTHQAKQHLGTYITHPLGNHLNNPRPLYLKASRLLWLHQTRSQLSGLSPLLSKVTKKSLSHHTTSTPLFYLPATSTDANTTHQAKAKAKAKAKANTPQRVHQRTQMGIVYKKYLSGEKILGCNGCKTHFATHDHIISKLFHGQFGRAYLFSNVVNVYTGEAEDRSMRTGLHTVQDIHCAECSQVVGWKYLVAYEHSERYKEGRFILERTLLHYMSG